MISTDNGETWSEPALIIGVEGMNAPWGDPTVVEINERWFMYFGKNLDGIGYAVYDETS